MKNRNAEPWPGLEVYDQRPREPATMMDGIVEFLTGMKVPPHGHNDSRPPVDADETIKYIFRSLIPSRRGLEKDPLVIDVPRFRGPAHQFLVDAGRDDTTPGRTLIKKFAKPVYPAGTHPYIIQRGERRYRED